MHTQYPFSEKSNQKQRLKKEKQISYNEAMPPGSIALMDAWLIVFSLGIFLKESLFVA